MCGRGTISHPGGEAQGTSQVVPLNGLLRRTPDQGASRQSGHALTVVVTHTLRAVETTPDSESGVLRMVSNNDALDATGSCHSTAERVRSPAERYLNFLCHNGFQAPTDLAGLMFWRELVKSGPLCGFRTLQESAVKAISRPAPRPPRLRLNSLRFRENCSHALARAVGGAPLRIHIGTSAGGH